MRVICLPQPCENPENPFHKTPAYIVPEERKDSEWNTFFLVAAIASILSVCIVTIVVYYVYFRWYSSMNTLRQAERLRRRRRNRISRARRLSRRERDDNLLTSRREGLDRAMVDALPVFVFKPESYENGLRCAVCLCEFEENDKARMLPSCNHSFHVDCIDMWFYSHSTCPLCRASVEDAHLSAQCVESGRREVDVSVMEEKAENRESINNSSASDAEERHDESVDINGDDSGRMEERNGPHVAIGIPTSTTEE